MEKQGTGVRFSPEVRARAVRMVLEHAGEYGSQWGAINSIAAERTGTLKTIEARGTIKAGFRKDEPPMSFVNSAGEPSGYSIDLCKAVGTEVANALGGKNLSMEFVPVTSSDRFTSVASGKVDILCEATTKTLKRSEIVDFTQLSFITGGALLSKTDAKIETVS